MMDDNNTEAIWRFGKNVVVEERDNTIETFIYLCNLSKKEKCGNYLGAIKRLVDFASQLQLDETVRQKVIALFIEVLDGFINNVFWNFEKSNGKYKIVTQDKKGKDFDIVTESDGLCTGQWEFIDRYSRYNTFEDILKTGEVEKKPEEE